jgi:hypothetical protein
MYITTIVSLLLLLFDLFIFIFIISSYKMAKLSKHVNFDFYYFCMNSNVNFVLMKIKI